MPEPQTLLMVTQPAESGIPAAREAWRAGAWPRPAGSTQPMIASSTRSGVTPACSSAAVIAVAPSVGVGTPVNCPSMEPMGVRLAPTMTMSVMAERLRVCELHRTSIIAPGAPESRGAPQFRTASCDGGCRKIRV